MGSWRKAVVSASASLLRRQCTTFRSAREISSTALSSGTSRNAIFDPSKLQEFRWMSSARYATTTAESVQTPEEKQTPKSDSQQAQAINQEPKLEPAAETINQEPVVEPQPVAKAPKHPVSWLSFILLLVTGGILLYYYDREKKRKMEAFTETSVKYGPSAGKAAIGGPFQLVNHDGKAVTQDDFKGNWTLIYFGFTSCPDICPDELQKMVQALDKIEKKNRMQITPLFISIDPERDTVEQVKEYVHEFHPRLIGLTGTTEDVKKAAKAFRVYYMKTGDEGDEDYLVDHSIIMYLMDKDMQFVKFFGKDYTADELAEGILKEIKNYKP